MSNFEEGLVVKKKEEKFLDFGSFIYNVTSVKRLRQF